MGALLPLEGRAPALAKPAEKAVLESSLETFLMTSILDTICFPLGGFSGEIWKTSQLGRGEGGGEEWEGLGGEGPCN